MSAGVTNMANELMSIAAEIREEINKSSTSWMRLGELLDKAKKAPGMEDNKAFGKWCDEQNFQVGRNNLFRYREAWREYSVVDQDQQQKLTDYNSWVKIASLNHVQKPRVLKRLEQADGKVTRKTVLEWIDQTRTQAKPPKEPAMNKDELKKAIKQAKAKEAMADKTEKYYQDLVREIRDLMNSDDYKMIRSCLHPDREVDADRKNKAFSAFQKFSEKCDQIVRKVFGSTA
jgi:flagellar biosynthesis regulator FlbT